MDRVIEQARLTPWPGNYEEMIGLDRSMGVLQDFRLLILLLSSLYPVLQLCLV